MEFSFVAVLFIDALQRMVRVAQEGQSKGLFFNDNEADN